MNGRRSFLAGAAALVVAPSLLPKPEPRGPDAGVWDDEMFRKLSIATGMPEWALRGEESSAPEPVRMSVLYGSDDVREVLVSRREAEGWIKTYEQCGYGSFCIRGDRLVPLG